VSEYVSVDLRRQVRSHFSDCCAYCRAAEDLTVAIFEIEHIQPRSAGGETVLENLALACPTCNRYKASNSSANDPLTGQEVALFHPQQDVWSTHFVWTDDGAEINGLTPQGRATIALLRINRPQAVRVRRLWVAMGEHPPAID